MGDKFLDELKEITGIKSIFKDYYKEGYKRGKDHSSNPLPYNQIGQKIKDSLRIARTSNPSAHLNHPTATGQLSEYANQGMTYALKNSDISLAVNSALLYESMGLGNRTSVKKRLLKVLKNVKKEEGIVKIDYYNLVKDFLIRNSENDKSGSLEGKVLTSVFSAITIAGILFGANSFTDAVVGITGKSSLTLGVGLFLAGILGLFISRGKF